MSKKTDEILALIDGGLQSTTELPFYLNTNGLCVRCSDVTTEGRDFCRACITWMSGETDVDPAKPPTFVPLQQEYPEGRVNPTPTGLAALISSSPLVISDDQRTPSWVTTAVDESSRVLTREMLLEWQAMARNSSASLGDISL
jgi:hypothetical protein